MTTSDKIALIVFSPIACLVIAFFVYGWYVSSEADYYQGEIAPQLHKDLGFVTGTPYVEINNERKEVLSLHGIKKGGIFDKAGFREGDIILDLQVSKLYKLLHNSRGQTVTIRVVDGGHGPPLKERPVRVINVMIPPAM